MEITILGTGCAKCNSLEKLMNQVVADLGIQATIIKEEDIMRIMEYGIVRTPGLVIDNKVIFSGRVPSRMEIEQVLTQQEKK
jgi:small redox-active disulfide protein 2